MDNSQSALKKRVVRFLITGAIIFVAVIGVSFVIMYFPSLFMGAK